MSLASAYLPQMKEVRRQDHENRLSRDETRKGIRQVVGSKQRGKVFPKIVFN